MSFALFPALRVSTTKLSGHASTISRVWVPMDPVDPRRERRFWKVDPLRDSARVRRADSSEFTGAEGLLSHPSPVPLLPEMAALRDVRVVDAGFSVKAEVAGTVNNVTRAQRDTFMMICLDE